MGPPLFETTLAVTPQHDANIALSYTPSAALAIDGSIEEIKDRTDSLPRLFMPPKLLFNINDHISKPQSNAVPAQVQRGRPSRSISDCITLEVCAGSAGLSNSLRKYGFQAIPVDQQNEVREH